VIFKKGDLVIYDNPILQKEGVFVSYLPNTESALIDFEDKVFNTPCMIKYIRPTMETLLDRLCE